ncbi:peptide/nickel transport system ATP-binding protein [Ketogulonicigenium robustum]|uniref:Nickel import system ATP-binding protein NikD n=1 Tax=Ketogulonicigenium robustum TaxID=92947 RepID=A0A1W6NZ05_9RHOB|nr:ATP-binding cassette domain-containing protein [Ketogulonicigenium robustum]ARO14478.1 peptide/nickel transport system ATP-binding protein [Ketogulonicigenium robustum]
MLRVAGLSVGVARPVGLRGTQVLPLLTDINLTVAAGEIVVVLGASGAGKSLLAHAIMNILPANAQCSGTIALHGHPITPLHPVALLPQHHGFLDPLARVGAQLSWMARRKGQAATPAALLASVGLDASVKRLMPHQLSGGMARRVLLALALGAAPDLIIADEPTAGLDPTNSTIVTTHLQTLAKRGGAALVITHDLMSVLPIATRVIVLDNGRIVAAAPAGQFTGAGEALPLPARNLWRALPENGFTDA